MNSHMKTLDKCEEEKKNSHRKLVFLQVQVKQFLVVKTSYQPVSSGAVSSSGLWGRCFLP